MVLSFETDDGVGTRARLGLVVLQADETIESEFRWFVDQTGVALYHSRVSSAPEVTLQTLARMEAEIPAAVSLLPSSIDFDVVGYACTSGSTVIGGENVADAIRSVIPEVATSDPLSAAKAACRALGVGRLAFITPYAAEVSAAMRRNFEDDGIEIAGFGSFEQIEEAVVGRISPASTLDAILNVGDSEACDAAFVSCTNLRAAGIIEEAEARLGKPVLSSNQVLAWHMLRLVGVNEPISGRGELFQIPL
jgi:maleate isomerase